MHFEFDGRSFSVVISARPLMLDGEVCRAKRDLQHRRLLLSGQLPRNERRRELFHELRHLWIDRRGLPKDEESDAAQSAEWMDEAMSQYQQQGGDAVLESLEPLDDVKLERETNPGMARRYADCGYCHTPNAIGSIQNDDARFHPEISLHLMSRGILCCICDHVTTWRESCTPEGMPIAIVPFPPPRVLEGLEAAEWITEHPNATRLVMNT